jgi:hypothetical protein
MGSGGDRGGPGWIGIAFVALAGTLAVVAGLAIGGMFTLPDSDWYLKMAQGETRSVIEPFSDRQLGPLIVRCLCTIPGMDVYRGFFLEGLISLALLLSITAHLLMRAGVPPVGLIAVGGLCYWTMLFNGLALPDLFFAALLSVFLLLLNRGRFLFVCIPN